MIHYDSTEGSTQPGSCSLKVLGRERLAEPNPILLCGLECLSARPHLYLIIHSRVSLEPSCRCHVYPESLGPPVQVCTPVSSLCLAPSLASLSSHPRTGPGGQEGVLLAISPVQALGTLFLARTWVGGHQAQEQDIQEAIGFVLQQHL
jgi:hypothetical protein